MSRTYRLGPGRRAVNSVVTALIKAGVGGRSKDPVAALVQEAGGTRCSGSAKPGPQPGPPGWAGMRPQTPAARQDR
jgi:hypothetical protein